MTTELWNQFRDKLDTALKKYKINEHINEALNNTAPNRNTLDTIWGNIAKCFTRTANKIIPNKTIDTDKERNTNRKLNDSHEGPNHDMWLDVIWLRKMISNHKLLDGQYIPESTLTSSNIRIRQINRKHKLNVISIPDHWSLQ